MHIYHVRAYIGTQVNLHHKIHTNHAYIHTSCMSKCTHTHTHTHNTYKSRPHAHNHTAINIFVPFVHYLIYIRIHARYLHVCMYAYIHINAGMRRYSDSGLDSRTSKQHSYKSYSYNQILNIHTRINTSVYIHPLCETA